MRILIDDQRAFPDPDPHDDIIRDPNAGLIWLVGLWDTFQRVSVDPFIELYLDHDMGPHKDTGLICRWLGTVAKIGHPFPASKIVIVTQNSVARENMKNHLHDYHLEYMELPLDPHFG